MVIYKTVSKYSNRWYIKVDPILVAMTRYMEYQHKLTYDIHDEDL